MLFSLFRQGQEEHHPPSTGFFGSRRFSARIAVYEMPGVPPRIVHVSERKAAEFINKLTSQAYELARDRGGSIPFIVVQEVVENLVHAAFRDAVITISPCGNSLSVSDQGPGFPDKEKAVRAGFSTATPAMKRLIKGVGSGLVVAREALQQAGGKLSIEDNLNGGAVVTVALGSAVRRSLTGQQEKALPAAGVDPGPEEYSAAAAEEAAPAASLSADSAVIGTVGLSHRQQRVLQVIGDCGAAGPSTVANRLHTSLSTAYRDLVSLEDQGLLEADEAGKRRLTSTGSQALASRRFTAGSP